MNYEYETMAWVDGKLVQVVATYELDGLEPLVYGVFALDNEDLDVTEKIHQDEFDRIYSAICADTVSTLADASDYMEDRRDHEREDNEYWAELEATK